MIQKAYSATNKMCELYKEKAEMEELGNIFLKSTLNIWFSPFFSRKPFIRTVFYKFSFHKSWKYVLV